VQARHAGQRKRFWRAERRCGKGYVAQAVNNQHAHHRIGQHFSEITNKFWRFAAVGEQQEREKARKHGAQRNREDRKQYLNRGKDHADRQSFLALRQRFSRM